MGVDNEGNEVWRRLDSFEGNKESLTDLVASSASEFISRTHDGGYLLTNDESFGVGVLLLKKINNTNSSPPDQTNSPTKSPTITTSTPTKSPSTTTKTQTKSPVPNQDTNNTDHNSN